MDIVNFQAFFEKGKVLTSAQIDPNLDLVLIGKRVAPPKSRGGQEYEIFVAPANAVGGGGGTLTGAQNLLGVIGTTVEMGGVALHDTTLDLAGFNLDVVNGANYSVRFLTRTAYDATSIPSLDWNNRVAIDNGGLTSISWQTRSLIDSTGNVTCDWEDGLLADNSVITSVDWLQRIAYDAAGVNSIKWSTRQIFGSAGFISINYDTRGLYDTSGSLSLDYTARKLRHNTTEGTVLWSMENTPGQVDYFIGTSDPEGTITGDTMSLFSRNASGTAHYYLKVTGSSNTGWKELIHTGIIADYAWVKGGNTVGSAQNIGTIDAFDFVTITSNTEQGRVKSTGEYWFGTTNFTGGVKVEIRDDTGMWIGSTSAGYGQIKFIPYSPTHLYSSIIDADNAELQMGGNFGANAGRWRLLFGNNQARFGINTNPTDATFQTKSEGSSSISYNQIHYNSGGSLIYAVRDDGFIGLNTLSPVVRFQIDNGNFLLNTAGYGARIGNVGIAGYSFWSLLANEISTNYGATSIDLVMQYTGEGKTVIGYNTPGAKLHVRNTSTASSTDNVFLLEGATGIVKFKVVESGLISAPGLQTGNAGLSTGDLYIDTSANITANGDYFIASKA